MLVSDLRKRESPLLSGLGSLPGILAVATVLLAFALRLYLLAESNIWWDEGWSVWLGREGIWEIALQTAADEHPPLHYFLLHLWQAVAGESAFAVRFSSLALATLTVALLYRVGRVVANQQVGFMAALFLAISRFHIWWSQEIKMYALATFLSLLSLYLFWRLLGNPRWLFWASFTLVNALALYTHYLTLLVVLAENGVLVLIALRRGRRGEPIRSLAVRWSLAQLILFLLFLPWLYLSATHPTVWRSPPPFQFSLFLRLAATVLSLGVTLEIDRYLWLVVGFVALTSAGLVLLLRGDKRERQGALLFGLTLGLPLVVIYLLSLPRATSFYAAKIEARYLLIFLPAYLLLLARGVWLLGRRFWPLGLLSLLFVVASQGYTLGGYYSSRHLKDDYATMVGYIKNYWQEGDIVVLDTDFPWPIFAYYYGEGPWHGIPNALEMTQEEAESLLAPLLAHYPGIWLLLSPDSLVQDPQGLLPSWLAAQTHEVVNLEYGDKRLLLYSREARHLCAIPPERLRIQNPLQSDLLPGLSLLGYNLPVQRVRTGDTLRLVSYWRAERLDHHIRFLLVAGDGRVLKEETLSLETGCSSGWQSGGVIRLEHDIAITSEIPSGRYGVFIGLEGGPEHRLRGIAVAQRRVSVAVTEPQHPMDLLLGEVVRLRGFDLERTEFSPGERIDLVLYWEAAREMETGYVVFTHLLGKEYNPQTGNFIWGQMDSPPLGGSYPTTGWAIGEGVADPYSIPIQPDAPRGDYELEVGMYEPVTGERLPVYDEKGLSKGNRIILGRVRVR